MKSIPERNSSANIYVFPSSSLPPLKHLWICAWCSFPLHSAKSFFSAFHHFSSVSLEQKLPPRYPRLNAMWFKKNICAGLRDECLRPSDVSFSRTPLSIKAKQIHSTERENGKRKNYLPHWVGKFKEKKKSPWELSRFLKLKRWKWKARRGVSMIIT